jgi:hypothetical protein
MRRLRHPVRAVSEPFGKAGLIVAVIALVMGLGGAAFAAQGLNGKQKKEVEKIAKKSAGKPGAPGATGPAGAAGKNGADGTNGSNGTNGAAGGQGVQGPPGTTGFTEKLPSGKTETGTWTATSESGSISPTAAISFSIPLAGALNESHVFYLRIGGSLAAECAALPAGPAKVECEEEAEAEEAAEADQCPGSVEVPLATAGNLCVYTGFANGLAQQLLEKGGSLFAATGAPQAPPGTAGAGTYGAILRLAGEGFAVGSWAVTAP